MVVPTHGGTQPTEVVGTAGVFPMPLDAWCEANEATEADLRTFIKSGAPLEIVEDKAEAEKGGDS